jgi:2-methylcitrate dehydratase
MTEDTGQLPLDPLLGELADYLCASAPDGDAALDAAHLTVMDTLGGGLAALADPDCRKRLGPIVPGTVVPNGARVPGTPHILDPVQAAFANSTMNRWLDYNESYFGKEGGHPSDNIGAVFSVCDYLSRNRRARGEAPLTMRDLIQACLMTHEVHGGLANENSYLDHGIDHELMIRVASAGVSCRLFGGDRDAVIAAITNAFADGGTLRLYRQPPTTGTRKCWAAGDASSRGVRLALLAVAGEDAYPTVLSAPKYGFVERRWGGDPFTLREPPSDKVIQNNVIKVWPTEGHAQSALEAAIRLHPEVSDRINDIERIAIRSHAYTMKQVDRTGPLRNEADRDHCIQYIVAIGLLQGRLTYEDYADERAADPRIDALRDITTVTMDEGFTSDYYDLAVKSDANAVQVHFKDGTSTEDVVVDFPLGHPVRREDGGLDRIAEKFEENIAAGLTKQQQDFILPLFHDRRALEAMDVDVFMDVLAG